MIGFILPTRAPGRTGAFLCAFACSAPAWAVSTNANPQVPPAAPGEDAPKTFEQRIEDRLKLLERDQQELGQRLDAEAAERLIQEARNEARAAAEESKPEEREFLEGGLALQKLNPELTFAGDLLAALVLDGRKFYGGESDRSGITVRSVALHLQHVLDPYSLFKSAFHICPHHGLHVEEVYIGWFGIIPSVSFSLGRFRQGFGVLNRWHQHDLDQTDYPLALTQVLGNEGLIGDGLMVKWLMPPLWAQVNELTLEVVNGNSEVLFSGEYYTVPSAMLHLKNYYDLTANTYLELGLTGMFGFNNRRGVPSPDGSLVDEPWRKTYVGGADLTLYWSPAAQARYHSFLWRSELFYANQEQPAALTSTNRQSWGVYSYVQYQPSARWYLGVRGDVVLPTIRARDEVAWDVVPYATFWQSEFVFLRLEYRHGWEIPFVAADGALARRTDDRVLLQVSFAAGPHKHEKY